MKNFSELTTDKHSIIYVISTPIGNLEDITLRAIRILKEVDLIAAEDTRHTRKLLSHYNISKELISYHSYNKIKTTEKIICALKEGKNVGLVSDAGTPGISDPGYYLINACITQNIKVVPIPGPSAAIAALSVSGLTMDRFLFEGFLPRKKGRNLSRLIKLAEEEKTVIIYESAMRLVNTLQKIYEVYGERKIVIARELTKIYEEIIRGNLSEIINNINSITLKGEMVLIIEGKQK